MSQIMKGEISIARYKRDGSFPIRAKQITYLTRINSKKYTCKLALLSREGAKERELKMVKLTLSYVQVMVQI